MPRSLSPNWAVLAGLIALGGAHTGRAEPGASSGAPALRGVTVGPIESSQHPRHGYGSRYSAELLDELVRLGANAISITPFGRLWSLDSTTIDMDFEQPYEQNRRDVARMIAQAKARGLYVLLIPHLWIDTGGWRGDLELGDDARWAEYQSSYRDFVLRWARDAAAFGADAFSVGVECKSWSGRFGAYWTSLIADVRASFNGPLTYSANWDEYEGVLFWDQLDFIGVNAFYPLSDKSGASDADYARGAARALDKLGAYADATAKPVLLVELGYTTRTDAAVKPWIWPDTMQAVIVDEHEQARALRAITSAAAARAFIAGFFLWRYYADLDDSSQEAGWGFSPHAKAAERVLSDVFSLPWASDPYTPPFAAPPLAPRERWPALLMKAAGRREDGKAKP